MYYYYKRYIVTPDCRTYPPTPLLNHLISGMPLTNSLKNRTNQIITDFGFTDSYKVGNGIDQGEIMSLLLQIIYYDPLFAKIEKIKNDKNIGYELDYNEENIRITDLAYMDDSTWIGKKKEELEKILQIADGFNEYNGIKVNKDKL